MGNIKGMEQNAPIIENKQGAKQSDVPMAMHLIDPLFAIQELEENIQKSPQQSAMIAIYDYMTEGKTRYLRNAITCLEKDPLEVMYIIGCVLKEGENKYPPNNWRNIPQEQHLNHALNHLYASIAGDTQDDHIGHAICRLMMSIVTKETKGFNYTQFVNKDIMNEGLWFGLNDNGRSCSIL